MAASSSKRRVVEVGTRGTRRAKTEGGEAPWQGRGRGGGGRRAREKSVSFSFFRLSLSSSPAPFSLSLSLLPRRLYSQQLGISQATLDIVFAASRVSFSLEILSAPRRAPPSVPILLLLSLSISRECRGCRARETRSSFEFTPAEESRESVPRGAATLSRASFSRPFKRFLFSSHDESNARRRSGRDHCQCTGDL